MSTESPAGNAVVIERILDAPIGTVWEMWVDPEHFKAWYGPKGASIPVANMDVQVGGKRLICMEMQTPNGTMQMWFTGEYLEVSSNLRLVFTESMSDENGNAKSPSEMGMPGDHPIVTEVTVELEDLGGQTKMVMTHAGVPQDSPGAMGWNMAFDKLTQYLDTQPASS